MVLLMNNLKNFYGKLNNITCVVGLMLGEIHKKQQSQKCDQEPIFKVYIGHVCGQGRSCLQSQSVHTNGTLG